MIKFSCDNCGQRLKVSEEFAGRKCKCPKCNRSLTIPTHPEFEFESAPQDVQQEHAQAQNESHNLNFLNSDMFDMPLKVADAPVTGKIPQEPALYGSDIDKESEPVVPKRQLPFIVDIFLYPVSTPGLVMLGVFIGIPLIIAITAALLGPFGFFVSIPGFFINLLVFLYMYWYMSLCIRDSAEGNIRAPDVMAEAPSPWDMLVQSLRIFVCLVFFAAPVFFYFRYTHKTDFVFWLLLGYGLFFFPMGLLAIVMHDSIEGLNPFLIIKSIAVTFFHYIGLFLLLAVVVSVYVIMFISPFTPSFVKIFSAIAFIYFLLVLAHLLGRFYWQNREKLDWEV